MAISKDEEFEEDSEELIEDLPADDLANLYEYTVRFSQEDEVYVGRVTEWDYVRAHGESPEEALEAVKNAVVAVIEDCREQKDEFPSPESLKEFSGKYSLRMMPSLHRELSMEAEREGVSLNKLINQKLAAS